MSHGLSVDVEDYYQVIYRDYFNCIVEPCAEVERNTVWLLDRFDEAGASATFFILGNVARKFPLLVKRISQQGHEIGIHGYEHDFVYTMKPSDFRNEIRRAKDAIEDLSGTSAMGFRAPAFSINESLIWASDILRELGFAYDASIKFPPERPLTACGGDGSIYRWPNGLYEIPLSSVNILGKSIPVAGGGYLRHFPYWLTKYILKRFERIHRSGIVYMHPYEFEESYPDISDRSVPFNLRIHTMLQGRNRGLKHRVKCKSLLTDFKFMPLHRLVENCSGLCAELKTPY
jgi:polysaccharide deacetylase family protein (PEP-CTERM system associated)